MSATSTLPQSLPYHVDRVVVIHATPDTVFRFFTDSARWAKWWGAGSTIDPKVGGRAFINMPGNVEASGEVLAIEAPSRFVFTYGFVSGKPIPAGSSKVSITLEPIHAGTRVTLKHELPTKDLGEDMVQGWRFQLSLFANVVTDEANANAATVADAWFQAWSDPDTSTRERTLAEIATPDVRFQDRFSNLEGLPDLFPHLAAAQRFMPGMRLTRHGNARHCQGMALVDWVATGSDGKERGRGTNAFVFGPTGKVEWVTGFWNAPG